MAGPSQGVWGWSQHSTLQFSEYLLNRYSLNKYAWILAGGVGVVAAPQLLRETPLATYGDTNGTKWTTFRVCGVGRGIPTTSGKCSSGVVSRSSPSRPAGLVRQSCPLKTQSFKLIFTVKFACFKIRCVGYCVPESRPNYCGELFRRRTRCPTLLLLLLLLLLPYSQRRDESSKSLCTSRRSRLIFGIQNLSFKLKF